MYAVIKTGGKQYRVQEGDVLRVEKLDAEAGKKITFDQVMLLGDGDAIKIGADVANAEVTAVVTEQGRGKKLVVFKRRRRKNYRLTQGHRQSFTAVRIESISKPKAAAKKAVAAADKE